MRRRKTRKTEERHCELKARGKCPVADADKPAKCIKSAEKSEATAQKGSCGARKDCGAGKVKGACAA